MNLKKILAQAALVAVVATGAVTVSNAPVFTQPQPAPVTSVVADGPQLLGGCIRLYPASAKGTPRPKWHVDADHWISGIDPEVDPVIDSAGYLTFWTIEKNAIISINPSPDETLTARGVSVGGSNGSHLVRLRFYKDGVGPLDLNKKIHYRYVAGDTSNIWVLLAQDGAWEATP